MWCYADWADPALLAATAPAAPANASARLAAASTYAAARSIPVSNKELPPGLTHTSAPRSHGQDAAAAAAASSANTSSLQARSSVSGTPTGRHSSREVVGGGGTNRTADEDPARETPLREIAFEGAHVLEVQGLRPSDSTAALEQAVERADRGRLPAVVR